MRFCVFPYIDYSTAVTDAGVAIPAELQVLDPDGNLVVPWRLRPVVLYPSSVFVGLGWRLSYNRGPDLTAPSLTMTFTDDMGSITLRFEKLDVDPGKPVDFQETLRQSGISIEGAQHSEVAYGRLLRKKPLAKRKP